MRIRGHKADGFFGVAFYFGGNVALDVSIPLDGFGWFVTKNQTRVYTVFGVSAEVDPKWTTIMAYIPYFIVVLMVARGGNRRQR